MDRTDVLLDVTRLVWRVWRGRLPTGIDRVCLAYLEHLGGRSLAVVQRKGHRLVFSAAQSDRLRLILMSGGSEARRRLVTLFATAGVAALPRQPRRGSLYLNVGHTGLNDATLPRWIARHGLKAIYLVHDLIPITHPETCRPGERERHELRMRHVLASATGVIANSKATLDALATFALAEGSAMPPAVVAWIAGKPGRKDSGPSTVAKKPPYYVVLGTIEGRKNHALLLDVWERLVQRLGGQAPKLLIIGGRGWQAEDVFRRLDESGPLQGIVEERGRCEDAELADLLAGARALLMPSRAEGFGLPLFEALETGIPAIAADLPVYREVAGDLPVYMPPDDVSGWEEAVLAFLFEDELRRQHTHRLRDFRAPGWSDHFATVEPWLERLQATG